jgi:hypothetical protein
MVTTSPGIAAVAERTEGRDRGADQRRGFWKRQLIGDRSERISVSHNRLSTPAAIRDAGYAQVAAVDQPATPARLAMPAMPSKPAVAVEVDACSGALEMLNPQMNSWGIYEAARRRAEKLKHPEPVEECYVRVKAPAGIGAVQTFSNRHITVGLDGIVEMSEEDAACLIPAGWIKLPDGPATT